MICCLVFPCFYYNIILFFANKDIGTPFKFFRRVSKGFHCEVSQQMTQQNFCFNIEYIFPQALPTIKGKKLFLHIALN